MTKTLKQYFPMIKTKNEIVREIQADINLQNIFQSWNKEQQEEFLNFCSGARGVKMLYDGFYKTIMDPSIHPERLEEQLSLLLGKKVEIIEVLPNDSTRIAYESSLLTTDIIVKLKDGELANVEIQKIGYAFPGERAACYSADLLLRQYRRLKSNKGKNFTYRNIQKVYTIVFFQKSPREFQRHIDDYVHHIKGKSNTGIEIELLQEYFFIPLDIFREKHQNGNISNKLDAWLTFLSFDEPDHIIDLVSQYPEFKMMYEDVYGICQNMERVMNMFSEELRELDRNTTQYMIDQLDEEIKQKEGELEQKKGELEQKKGELEQKESELERKNEELRLSNEELKHKDEIIKRLEAQLKKNSL